MFCLLEEREHPLEGRVPRVSGQDGRHHVCDRRIIVSWTAQCAVAQPSTRSFHTHSAVHGGSASLPLLDAVSLHSLSLARKCPQGKGTVVASTLHLARLVKHDTALQSMLYVQNMHMYILSRASQLLFV